MTNPKDGGPTRDELAMAAPISLEYTERILDSAPQTVLECDFKPKAPEWVVRRNVELRYQWADAMLAAREKAND